MFLEHWGATSEEIRGEVVGDELVADAALVATRAIDLDAPPAAVFPWLVQMGFGRAGWYSYDWLDNLGRPSARRIHAEWQDLRPGDLVPGGPIHFVAEVVHAPTALVLRTQPVGRVMERIAFTLAFEVRARPGGSRLVSRVRARLDLPFGRAMARFLLGPGDGIMVRRQLLNLRVRTAASGGCQPPQ